MADGEAPPRPLGNDEAMLANQALWDIWTGIHASGDFYDLAGFRVGGVRIQPYGLEMIGDVAGRSLLHLQCHFGIDTLSFARLGARVTGADLSPAAVELASSLAVDLGFPEARFVQSNVYERPANLDGRFDIVYTSRGVLGWLSDIRAWANVVANFLAPGGVFFITEMHPASRSGRQDRWTEALAGKLPAVHLVRVRHVWCLCMAWRANHLRSERALARLLRARI